MKKVLMGLLAISAISFAEVDLPNADTVAAEGTNIFKTGQYGAVSVTGTVTSTVPQVTYVIYADNGNGTKDEVLKLKDFILSRPTDAKQGFQETNGTIYVKKVVNGDVQDITGSTIEYSASSGASGVTGVENINFHGAGTRYYTAFKILSPARREALLNALGQIDGSKVTIDSTGYLITESGKYYPNSKNINIIYGEDGTIKFENRNVDWSTSELMSEEGLKKVENYFSGGIAIDDLQIYVRVN